MAYTDMHQNFISQSKYTLCAVPCNVNLCTFAGMQCCTPVVHVCFIDWVDL